MPTSKKYLRGFTLIEIMVSIMILAVVSAIGFATYSNAQISARDARRKEDLKAIQGALELYYQKNKSYPQTGWVNSTTGGTWLTGLDVSYINPLPSDPKNSTTNCNSAGNFPTACYTYGYYGSTYCDSTPAGQAYLLATRLENSADTQAGKGVYWAGNTSCAWGAQSGIYSVSSP